MRLSQRIIKGAAVLGIAGSAYFGQYISNDANNRNVAMARTIAAYDPKIDPFEPDQALKAIAKKAKAGSEAETIRNLHSYLKIKSPGGLKLSSSGGAKEERPPRTAAQTLNKGGDCSEFGYVVHATAKFLGLESGFVFLDVGGNILHMLPYVQADGKRYLVDLQLDDFGIGGAQLPSGKVVTFTYEEAKKGKRVKFLRELSADQASAAFHMEWGTYLDDNKDFRNALLAFKVAHKIDPGFAYLQKKVRAVSMKIFSQKMKEATKAFNAQNWQKAAGLFEEAIASFPDSIDNNQKASVHGNAGACHYNARNFSKAIEHYETAYKLSGDKEYKKHADDAREKGKE